jgi:RimJ/RimL family protein N-acetyltransferase
MQQACAPASITKYMSLAFAHPYTLQHAETWISTNLTENLPNYVLTLHDSPTVVMGGVGLKPGSDVQSHTAEVGYWIAEEYWGMGYMTEALRAFTDYVFSEKGDVWRRLWAGVFSGNEASMGTLKKCGYAEEGVMKGHVEKHGEVRDLHMFGLTRKDWEATKQSRT